MTHYTHEVARLTWPLELSQLIALQNIKAISLEISRETPLILARLKVDGEKIWRIAEQFKKYQGE